MPVTAKLRYLHIAPRKVREVADLIRGKRVDEAQTILEFLVKKPAKPVLKLLKNAITQAKNNFQLEQSNLYISKVLVDQGPSLKRWRPVSRGRAFPIMKRTSHLTIVLSEIKKKERIKEAKPKAKPKVKPKVAVPEARPKEEEKRLAEKPLKEGKPPTGRPKFKPAAKGEPRQRREKEIKKSKKEFGLKRIFKRKAF